MRIPWYNSSFCGTILVSLCILEGFLEQIASAVSFNAMRLSLNVSKVTEQLSEVAGAAGI